MSKAIVLSTVRAHPSCCWATRSLKILLTVVDLGGCAYGWRTWSPLVREAGGEVQAFLGAGQSAQRV